MRFADFELIFRDGGIRAMLNWHALSEFDCPVRETFSRSPEKLAALNTVWYRRPDGAQGDWREPESRPLRVGECARTAGTWGPYRSRHIEAFRKKFARAGRPVQLVLPAYVVGPAETLLLDGTHRAVAACLAGVEVRLLMFSLEGPLDPAMLPDLGRYIEGSRVDSP